MPSNQSAIPGLIKLIRIKHWVKNLFVLAPLLFSGLLPDTDAILNSLEALLIFCLASSAVYILNDILDIDIDKAHPEKSISRPLASGQITLPQAKNTAHFPVCNDTSDCVTFTLCYRNRYHVHRYQYRLQSPIKAHSRH